VALRQRPAFSLRRRFAHIAGGFAVSILVASTPATVQAQLERAQPSASPKEAGATEQFVLGSRPFAASSSWNSRIPAGAIFIPLNWPVSTGYNYGVTWSQYSPSIYTSSEADPIVT